MKLCRIALNFLPEIGGAVGHIVELSKNLEPHLTGQFLITKKYYDERYDDREYERSSGLQIYREDLVRWLPQGRLQSISFIPFAIRRVLWLDRKHGIDMIQAHCVWTGIAAIIAGKVLRKPVIWMAHGTDEAYGRIQGITETLITRIFRPNYLFVLDDGSNAPSKFKRLLGDRKVTVVYHGIDIEKFNPKYVNKELKKRLKINDNAFVITSTSLLIPVKRVDYAISAFKEFLEISEAKDAVLLIIGEGPLKAQLEKMISDYGIEDKVKLLGRIAHSVIRDYLSISNVVIATSPHSNVNRSIMEAMSCGKPVLASDSGNIGKIFLHMENCLIAKTGDIKDFAAKLLLLYKDADFGDRLGRNARIFIEENRSWENRIRTELRVFENLLKRAYN